MRSVNRFDSGQTGCSNFSRAGLRRAIGTTKEMFRNHIEHQLPRITTRTLVIRGGTDPTVPQPAALAMTHLLAQGELYVIEGEPRLCSLHQSSWGLDSNSGPCRAQPYQGHHELQPAGGTITGRVPPRGSTPVVRVARSRRK